MAHPAPERLRVRNRFEEICSEYPEWTSLSDEKKETLIRRMERNCFEVTINSCIQDGVDRLFTEKKFVQRYSSNCSRVMANLDYNSSIGSNYLIKKLINGEVDPYKIAELSSKDLCPDASQAERDEIELRQKQKFKGKVSRAYTCRKCKGNETIPLEYQGRCADEGSNFSIKCVNCEFVWRH